MASFIAAAITAEVVTVASVAAAVATTGAIVDAVGMVTGSRALTNIGSAMALGGGAASLAAGAFGAAAEGATSTAGSEVADLLANSTLGGNEVADNIIKGSTGQSALGVTSGDLSSVNQFNGSPTFNDMGQQLGGATTSEAVPAAYNSTTDAYGNAITGSSSPATDLTSPDGTLANTGPATNLTPPTPADSVFDKLSKALGKGVDEVKSIYNGLDANGKSMLLKSVMAIPGGIQNQQNTKAMLDIQRQNANTNASSVGQRSYGSSVPTTGIINNSMRTA
jgi:hypothetical protein